MPITFNWMSPVLIVMGGLEGFMTMSFLIFAVWFISSFFVGRTYCEYGYQWGATQELLAYAVPGINIPEEFGSDHLPVITILTYS